MIFNSVSFIAFLIVMVALYWLLPRRARLWMVFLGSCVFYSFWRVEFLPIMLLSAVTDYVASLQIYKSNRLAQRRFWFGISLFINLGLLFYFKYTIFFLDNIWQGLRLLGVESAPPMLNIILPLGISFYTFQTMSYTIDVYRGFIRPQRDFVLYACYVTYFPQLVAGPILRAREVIGQLSARCAFNAMDVSIGLRRVLYGLLLKVFLADNISPLVDAGFDTPTNMLSALDVWTLAFLFGFQIYFDFSAYSHIALGSARMMGISFPENFNFPYMANSPQDFWRRWHISLSSWIRDYLYLPLCGSQVQDRSDGGLASAALPQHQSNKKTRALFLTWAIMGLWHGANWTFVAWGLYHACFIYGYRKTAGLRNRLPNILRQYGGGCLTLVVVMLGWIPFRARSMTTTAVMYGKLFDPSQYLWRGMRENTYLVTAIILMLIISCYLFKTEVLPVIRKWQPVWAVAETVGFTVIIALVIIFLRPISQFIYFQF
jgi:D-alanyl-lipoteichoic acid acyltransferase DltB (MBOAT superfamily)